MISKNKFLKILMIVFIMLLQISCSKAYDNVEEDGKGKIIIYYNNLTKTFVMKSEEEGSVLSRDKMQEFYKKIDRENMNKEGYTLKLKNKIKAPVDSSYLFSLGDNGKLLYIKIEGLENLDVSKVENMGFMFYGAIQANPDVSKWDVSNVKDMSGMFLRTDLANPDVSKWDVSNVKDMRYMFSYTSQADPDVSSWDVSNVEDMHDMFSYASQANPDISKWDVSNVEYIRDMFLGVDKFIGETKAKINNLENKTEEEKEKLKSYITDGNVGHLKKLIYELNESKK